MEYKTSVKTIKVLKDSTPTQTGVADFSMNPVYSVFDVGTIVPPHPLDNSTVTTMAAFNFEMLQEAKVKSHYRGVTNSDGELFNSVKYLIKRDEIPSAIRVKYVNRVMPIFNEETGTYDYSPFHNSKENNFILPLEVIMRERLGEKSSVWKRVAKGELNPAEMDIENLKPGDKPPHTIIDFSTKLEKEDRYLTPQEARKLIGFSEDEFESLKLNARKISSELTSYATSVGFEREDGKVEYIICPRPQGLIKSNILIERDDEVLLEAILADAAGTWHEDRFLFEGLPISKQLIRDEIVKVSPKWYEEVEKCKEEAKVKGVQDFTTLMNPKIQFESPSIEFFEDINRLFQVATNLWIGEELYKVYNDKSESLLDNMRRVTEEFRRKHIK